MKRLKRFGKSWFWRQTDNEMKATAAACSLGLYGYELKEHYKSFSRVTIIFPTFRRFQDNNNCIKVKHFKMCLDATKGRVKNTFCIKRRQYDMII